MILQYLLPDEDEGGEDTPQEPPEEEQLPAFVTKLENITLYDLSNNDTPLDTTFTAYEINMLNIEENDERIPIYKQFLEDKKVDVEFCLVSNNQVSSHFTFTFKNNNEFISGLEQLKNLTEKYIYLFTQ